MDMDDTLRAADRDRDQVAETLREHYAQGRLTMEEFDERSTAAATAKTMGDLRALTADLPIPAEPREIAPAWSRGRMTWIAVAGIAATAIVLGGAAFAGHFMFAWPSWLVILIVVRVLHGGRRRYPHARGPRARRD
jgi:uncharacterized membrane protein